MKREDVRNVAIIAHVDHGRAIPVSGLLKASGIFRENQDAQGRVMDSNDTEREREITILPKNTTINYKNYKTNIIDTPGHADFGGEVERVLKMTDGVVLVVDASEGSMPQTEPILKKAFELDLSTIIYVNRIGRKEARVDEVVDKVLDLLIQLNTDESYLDSSFVHASAREKFATDDLSKRPGDMTALLDKIIDYIPTPEGEEDAPFKPLTSTADFGNYVGRTDIGKIEQGKVKVNDSCVIINYDGPDRKKKMKVTKIYEFDGLSRVEVDESKFGSTVALIGVERIEIGNVLANEEDCESTELISISNSTLTINFSVNSSPFAGRDGKFITSRQVRSRLYKELETDVSLKVEDTGSTDTFGVSGKGELHLSILIENMRHEGFEFQVLKPEILFKKDKDGKVLEPTEIVTIDIEEGFIGTIIRKLGTRKGELQDISNVSSEYTRLILEIPSRDLIRYRQEFLSDTKGNGVINTELKGYESYKRKIPKRQLGSLISYNIDTVAAYGLNAAQDKGILFVRPQDGAYEGMVVGSSAKGLDIEADICKKKAQINIRPSAADEVLKSSPPKIMNLEEMMESVEEDELIEIVPHHLRLKKRILDTQLRYKSKRYNK